MSHDARLLLAAPARQCRGAALGPVMMGRAAAVREKKKGKTDAAKTKLNSRYPNTTPPGLGGGLNGGLEHS